MKRLYSFRRLCPIGLLMIFGLRIPTVVRADDCNANGVEDALDVAGTASVDCNGNGTPDECESDFDGDGIIDGCDDCGLRLTDNNVNDLWGTRQKSTSRGRVLWVDQNQTIFFYDGSAVTALQAKDVNVPELDDATTTVFGVGGGSGPNDVLAGWRRGTDFGWVWANNGLPPQLVHYASPYNAGDAMNPEGVAAADGCLFMLLQAFDPGTNVLIKHVYRIDPDSGASTLLTGDFLGDTATGGTGAFSNSLVTSGCRAAWAWCRKGANGACDADGVELHYYDGAAVQVLDADAVPHSFALGRLIYVKPVAGVDQVFLFDTNLPGATPMQLTSFGPGDPRVIFAASDGRHVAILRGDANFMNRDIVTLGGFALTDDQTRPADSPSNADAPIQADRGQLHWEAQNGSAYVFNGLALNTACRPGWMADGFVATSQKTGATGDDTEIFLKQLAVPADPAVPYAPWAVRATVTGNGEVSLEWEPILGATSYRVYFAAAPGVTKANYLSLPGGQASPVVGAPQTVVHGLAGNQTWSFVVTTVDGSGESAESREVTAIPCLDDALDQDADGTPDCDDGCVNDPAKTAPGACGCGIPDDANGDGAPDCVPAGALPTPCGTCGAGVPLMLALNLVWLGRQRRRAVGPMTVHSVRRGRI